VVKCLHCGTPTAAGILLYCKECISSGEEEIAEHLKRVHCTVREASGLPQVSGEEGPQCRVCYRSCRPAPGSRGYCGLRENRGGKLIHLAGTPSKGLLQYYYDPIPTNCVAEWVCPEKGGVPGRRKNLAVFYGACTLNCLFCQNWQYRSLAVRMPRFYSADELAAAADGQTACICFFGGDPAPQVPHALSAARRALQKKPDLRICWETSGLMSAPFFARVLDLSLQSGGTVKFDLKAWDKGIYFALTGGNNEQALKNFTLSARAGREKGVTLTVASTLLVPGYVDAEEVRAIASFIAGEDPAIPYTLLAFHPQFYMKDLPLTSRETALECLEAAQEEGLKRVRLANEHLLF